MSFLDNVQMAFECPLAWDKLVGNDTTRHCGQCDKHVTNLSAMTRPQARKYLSENQDAPICIRVEVDDKGKAVHRASLAAPLIPATVLISAIAVGDGGKGCVADPGCSKDDAVELLGAVAPYELIEDDPDTTQHIEDTGMVLLGEIEMIPEPPVVDLVGRIAMPIDPVEQTTK